MGARRHLFALVMLVALAGCSSTSDDAASDPTSAAPTTASAAPTTAAGTSTPYVALGDSYTAGPGINPLQPDSGFCQRSTVNWPSLVAEQTGLPLTDVSCIGATTTDVASTVTSGALDGAPQLVTVGTGGNDGGLFSSLLTACAGGTGACATFVDGSLPGILQQTTTDIAALLDQIGTAVPGAEVLLVGYPRIAPPTGGCAAIGIADTAPVVNAETALDAALAAAAEQAGGRYVSLRETSLGHDACAGGDAWTNGRSGAPGDGISFHPTKRGMEAVAKIVAQTAGSDDLR